MAHLGPDPFFFHLHLESLCIDKLWEDMLTCICLILDVCVCPALVVPGIHTYSDQQTTDQPTKQHNLLLKNNPLILPVIIKTKHLAYVYLHLRRS